MFAEKYSNGPGHTKAALDGTMHLFFPIHNYTSQTPHAIFIDTFPSASCCPPHPYSA